jgi:hypothetical protein
MMNHIGERVREFYRKQGEERIVDRIIQDLLADAYLAMLCSADDMERLTGIVENALQPVQVRPNN